jgi:hypothetical protein
LLRLPLWAKIDFETGPYWIFNLLNIPNILNWKNSSFDSKVRCSQTHDTKGFRDKACLNMAKNQTILN